MKVKLSFLTLNRRNKQQQQTYNNCQNNCVHDVNVTTSKRDFVYKTCQSFFYFLLYFQGTIAFADPDDEQVSSEEKDDDDLNWNIRKCSAAALDVLSSVFEDEILQYVLPELERLLTSSDWMELESGILILGAIAEGCTEGMVDHLPSLINQMINVGLKSDKALVRSITCWTLSRYSSWVVKTTLENYACTKS